MLTTNTCQDALYNHATRVPGNPVESTSPRARDGSRGGLPSRAHTFVGRQAELEHLKRLFDTASGGRGTLVMLVGEPAIGKTALCEELGVSVTAAGGQTLVGHCYAEGSFRPPYQPFVEALDTYVQGSNPQVLTTDLGSGAVELARTLPTLGEQLNFPRRSAGDPEEDRWRLLEAATQLLRVAAMHRPLLLVLEDLHDADRGALDLLLHLARNLGTAPALVVGWCCGVCPSRGHSHPSSVSYPSWWRPSIWPMGSTGSWPTSAVIACSSSGLSWTHPGSSGRGGDIRSRPLVSSVLTCVCR